MQLDINLNPKLKERRNTYYAALSLFIAAFLVFVLTAVWFFQAFRDYSTAHKRLESLQHEQEKLEQELKQQVGQEGVSHQDRYPQLVNMLEEVYVFTLDEISRQLYRGLPQGGKMANLILDTNGRGYLEVEIDTLGEAASYLNVLSSLPFVQSATLTTVKKDEDTRYTAVYELTVHVSRGSE